MATCIECHERVDEESPCLCGRCEDCCSALLPCMKGDDPRDYAEEDGKQYDAGADKPEKKHE